MLEIISQNFDDIIAIDALGILVNEFAMEDEEIMFNGTQRTVSIKNLRVEYASLPGVLAKYVSPIKFWGGPGALRDYYTGSLMTLLCDRILNAWCYKGLYADLVESYTC